MASLLSVHNVSKDYGNGKGVADISLEIQKGEIFGFLGPNGAGKTTAIRCIMDFIRPDKGTVTVSGKNVQRDPSVRASIGFIPSDPQLYPHWTGKQHLSFYKNSGRSIQSADNLSKQLDLDLETPFKQLSTGNKQKLALVLAFAGRPKLLVMDEPTKGLDPLLQQTIYQLLAEYRKQGGTVFLSSHNLPEVEKICDRVGVIKSGRIVANETMQTIRAMSIHLVTAVASTQFNIADFADKNVEIIHHANHHILLKVRGDLNTVIKKLSSYKLKDLEVTHANLEDIFMEYYQ